MLHGQILFGLVKHGADIILKPIKLSNKLRGLNLRSIEVSKVYLPVDSDQ